jgi:hypothetical protein
MEVGTVGLIAVRHALGWALQRPTDYFALIITYGLGVRLPGRGGRQASAVLDGSVMTRSADRLTRFGEDFRRLVFTYVGEGSAVWAGHARPASSGPFAPELLAVRLSYADDTQ